MQPNINPSLPPPFWQLHPVDQFQPLCRDILNLDRDISGWVVYGTNGQAQKGIDLFAETASKEVIAVAQCKCCEHFNESSLKKACEDFINHLEHWKSQGVERFILIVAGHADRTQVRDGVREQKRYFMQLGITFEFWDGNDLRDKLHPHRNIAERHIHSVEVVDNICGRKLVEPNVWREATSVRRPKRSDLIKLLSPIQYLPDIEILYGILTFTDNPEYSKLSSDELKYPDPEEGIPSQYIWNLFVEMYIEPKTELRVVIPFHKCQVDLYIGNNSFEKSLSGIYMQPPFNVITDILTKTKRKEILSQTIKETGTEILIEGPGKVQLTAKIPEWSYPIILEGQVPESVSVDIFLTPSGLKALPKINVVMHHNKLIADMSHDWEFKKV
jgi:hypothetical protein